jgi:hypothetical protein
VAFCHVCPTRLDPIYIYPPTVTSGLTAAHGSEETTLRENRDTRCRFHIQNPEEQRFIVLRSLLSGNTHPRAARYLYASGGSRAGVSWASYARTLKWQ